MAVFLFTDIEGYTQLWEEHMGQMGAAVTRHDSILAEYILVYGGRVIKHTGDGVFALFEGGDPLCCALEIQKAFFTENWGEIGELRIRIALHAGEAEQHGNDYFGPAVNRTARLVTIAWGGQILMTPEVIDICKFPPGATLHDLGVHVLKDLSRPQHIYEMLCPDLPIQKFPPLKSLSAGRDSLPDALQKARDYKVTSLTMYALVGMARVREMEGSLEQAVELLALVLAHSPSDMVKDRAKGMLNELQGKLAPEVVAAALERGRALDIDEAVGRLLNEQA